MYETTNKETKTKQIRKQKQIYFCYFCHYSLINVVEIVGSDNSSCFKMKY